MSAVPGATDDATPDVCTGRGGADGSHCCVVAGQACRFLTDNGPGADRRFECSLRRDLGSWDAVHADPGYQRHVQAEWDKVGISSCGEWQPPSGHCCREPREVSDGDAA